MHESCTMKFIMQKQEKRLLCRTDVCCNEQILVGLVSSYRYDKEVVDSNIANVEAVKLHEAIKSKKLDDDEFLQILSTRNMFQLRQTFKCYKDNYGKSIDQV